MGRHNKNIKPRYGVHPLEKLGTNPSSNPKVPDYTDCRATAQHGAYAPRSLAREGGSLCPPCPARKVVSSCNIYPSWAPHLQCHDPNASAKVFLCPIQIEQHDYQIPYQRTVISLCNSVLKRLCASCSV